MEKAVAVACTLLTFIVMFAVLSAWELDASVRFIWAGMFAAAFSYLFFGTRKKSKK